MKTVKALVIKDLLQLKTYQKTLIVFIFIFMITAFVQSSADMISAMLVMMLTFGFGMFSLASFNYDEASKADKYILTLPVTKKDVVRAKYVLIILATVVGALIGMVAALVVSFIASQVKPDVVKELPNLYELLCVALGGILGIGCMQSIQAPCIYKWGAEKGRMMIFLVVGVVAILIGIVAMLISNLNLTVFTPEIIQTLEKILPLIIVVLIIIIYFVSYKIAYKIYQNKEL